MSETVVAETLRSEIALDDIPFGEGRTVTVGEDQVAVFRLRGPDGEPLIRAVSAVCPHLGGPIADGQTDGGKVVCPLHLHTFDLSDGCGLTGQPALKVYPVEIADGKVVIAAP
jgi:nitrite reductase (NADH) small subunit